MFYLEKKFFTALFFAFSVSFPVWSVKHTFISQEDRTETTVDLPFEYYQRKDGDRLDLVHQGGYKIYDVQNAQKHVAVVGYLCPCVGIAVTDGAKIALFHKHSANNPAFMQKILEDNLDLTKKTDWVARLFTVRDEQDWGMRRNILHEGKDHRGEVKHLKDFLNQMGMQRENIQAQLWSLLGEDILGRYMLAELYVGVRMDEVFQRINEKKQIKFCSIDPFGEDIFGYKGTLVSLEEVSQGSNLKQRGKVFAPSSLSYDLLPAIRQASGKPGGYKPQLSVFRNRTLREMDQFYFKHFGKSFQNLMAESRYETLAFYPI